MLRITQPHLKQNNVIKRLLDFCEKPLSTEVTIFCLNLMIKFTEAEQIANSAGGKMQGPTILQKEVVRD